jgi:hypothetical protein
MWEEFKKFIMRGNVVDLAVGAIIGLAFGAIVNSLVNDLIMPIMRPRRWRREGPQAGERPIQEAARRGSPRAYLRDERVALAS